MSRRISNARARWGPKFSELSMEFGEPFIAPVVNMYRKQDYFGLVMVVCAFFSFTMFTIAGGMSIMLVRLG